jgi:hypothetical protein
MMIARLKTVTLTGVVLVLLVGVSMLRSGNDLIHDVNTSLQQKERGDSHGLDRVSRDAVQVRLSQEKDPRMPVSRAKDPSNIRTQSTKTATAAVPNKKRSSTAAIPMPPLSENIYKPEFHVFPKRINGTGTFQTPKLRAACKPMIPDWILDIEPALENKVFSQFGEDGITQYLIDHLPSTIPKTYVEFGVENGSECNTRYLRQRLGWKGLMMDGGNNRPAIGLHREMMHPDNIVELFRKYGVEKDFGYLSEDTDYADFYLWRSILEAGYRPHILVSEINSNFYPHESVTVHDPGSKIRMWKHDDYFGVSPLALRRLWNKHGYIMICEFPGRQLEMVWLP